MDDKGEKNAGPLKMIVCIKQVPLLSALRFDPATRRLVREGVPLEMNELDVYAVSEAIRLGERYGGEVIAITMGPPEGEEVLGTERGMGADRAIPVCDRAFGGADTAATARTLALAIQREHADLILCGRHSIDAETAQVGPEIAEMLDIPQISAIISIDIHITHAGRQIIATRETDEGSETLLVPLPALVTAAERLNEGIWPDEHAIRKASEQNELYQLVTAADLQTDPRTLGQPGSPTWVANVEPDTHTRAGRIIAEADPTQAIDLLVADLEDQGLLRPDTEEQNAIEHHLRQAAPLRLGDPVAAKAVWIVAEQDQRGIRQVTRELLGKGNALAAAMQGELAALLIGGDDVIQHTSTLAAYGAEKVYVAADSAQADYTTDGYTAVLAAAIQRYNPAKVLLGSTANGRGLAPRVAARLHLGLTGDCIDLAIDEQQRLVQYKPAFGGSIISLILSNTTPAMATLRPGMLHASEPHFKRRPTIVTLPTTGIAQHISPQVTARTLQDTGVAELESARFILGIGMGMGTPVEYVPAYQLAQLLHAAIGATRNVTDQGWLPKQMQIGLTGRAVAPRLYLALGVRGASEHIAGIRKANYIVSFNKNKRAAIFRHSDIGVVGDVHVLLPLLIERLQGRLELR